VELATVRPRGDAAERTLLAPEHALQFRYQQNLTRSTLLRLDLMVADRESAPNLSGIRAELRIKF
jgi:cell division FtsZ-interacting protein ZapD